MEIKTMGDFISPGYFNIYEKHIENLMIEYNCSREEVVAMIEAEEEAAKEKERLQELEDIKNRMNSKNLPLELMNASFENFETDTQNQAEGLSVAKAFVENKDFLVLVLAGNHGMGKSHLGVSVIRAKKGIGKYILSKDLCLEFNDARRGFEKSQKEVLAGLMDYDLLVIDELGFTYDNSDDRPLIQGILFDRIAAGKKTILISNKDQKQTIADLGAKIFDRMKLCGKIFELKGMSFREQLAAKFKKSAA